MERFNIPSLLLIWALIILPVGGCAEIQNTSTDASVKSFSVYKQITLDEIGSFNFERRMYFYETIDELANQLLYSPKYKIVKQARTKLEVFKEEYPILKLSDRDLDGKADQFSYNPEGGDNTQEFGFIFDLNKDGKIDYIVFNGGPISNKNFDEFFWQNYHWIDSNDDGKLDVYVYNNNIDIDGDTYLDEGISGWVYDTNFDGLVDKAEYLGEGLQQPIEKKDGNFIIKTIFGEKMWGEDNDFEMLDPLLSDINSIAP